MRLSWDYLYEDYSDSKNWPPRFEELKAVAAKLEQANLTELSDTAILERLEEVEELMRYYTSISDYKNLETIMRLQYRLMQQGENAGLSGVAFRYFRLIFERVNAVLYRADGQNRKAADEYAKACETAEQCISELKRDESLEDKQKLYIGWACHEVLDEASQVFASIVDYSKALAYCDRTLSLLKWLEPYMADSPSIQNKTADVYFSYGGIFYQNGNIEKGRNCYETSIHMLEKLSEQHNSDFCYAHSLWVMANYGLQAFTCSGDASILLDCEVKSNAALNERFKDECEIAIAEAAIALILIQKGLVYQQSGKSAEAVQHTKQGVSLCKSSLDKLDSIAEINRIYYRTIIKAIAVRVFASYTGALDTLGILLYFDNKYEDSKETFENLLTILNKQSEYALSEAAGTIIRAECSNYMALISAEEGDNDAFEFYAEQAALLSSNIAKKINNAAILQIESQACSLLAEYYLNAKNKSKALKYAEMGLSACDELQRLAPQNCQPQLVQMLEKFKKKASRKFF